MRKYAKLRVWLAMLGGIIVLGTALVAIFAPLLVPHDPFLQDLGSRMIPPEWMEGGRPENLLGTDQLGRDYLSRLIYGARISMLIGVLTVVASGLIGITLGLLGGFFGGRVDDVVMFIITCRLSIPLILVALAVVSLVGSSLTVVVLTLGLLLWDRFAVVARTTTMQVRTLDYVSAAWAAGCSRPRILLREILPNIAHHLIVVATLEMALAILLEAALSFLGLGVPPPLPSWGLMIAEAKDYMFFSPWVIMVPGIALFVLVLGINLLGDGMRDLLGATRGRMSDALLEISGLRVRFGTHTEAVRGVSLEVRRGETHCLVGESGCGKSVSALAVMGLLSRSAHRTADRLRFRGEDMGGLSERALSKLRGNAMGMIFQEPMTSLNPAYTVGSQMAEVFRRHRGASQRQALDRAADLLGRVGITAPGMRLAQYPHQLSGGLRQRVMIAMALMCDPELLIADEPTTALDVTVQAQILRLLLELQRELGLAILLITHDLGVVARMAHRVSVMYAGQVVESANAAALFATPTHPYTVGLLDCVPTPGKTPRDQPLGSIPGTVPRIPPGYVGCAFRDRCAHAMPDCATAVPTQTRAPGHEYLCRLAPDWQALAGQAA